MKETTTRQLDANILAVLHEAGGQWSAVVADLQGSQPRILDSTRFDRSSADLARDLVGWLDRHNVGEVLGVVPASSTICRTCTLPDAEPDELEESLSLQAEAHLEGIAPQYRTATAILPAAASESNRMGLMLAWPENAGSLGLPNLHRPVHYTADVAALAALLDANRSDEPLLWVDRHNDAVAMAISHANGAALRATREGGDDDEALTRGIQRALAETAFNVGHSGEYVGKLTQTAARHSQSIQRDQAALLLPADLKSQLSDRVDGAGADNQWWSNYGIAVGAVLARHGSLASLTTMMDAPPAEAPTIFHRIGEQLAQPKNAAIAVAAAVLLIAFAPVLFNGLRLAALTVRYNDIDTKLTAVRDTKQRLSMYEELQDDAWPMIKLLADVANCTPLGIELETVRINQGQFVTVAGIASPRDGVRATDLIAKMERQLRDTGIFTSINYTWDNPTANGSYPFDLNAAVVRPHRRVAYDVEQDFGKWPHEARRNGDPPPGDGEGDTATAGRDEPRTRVASAENTAGDRSTGAPTGAPTNTDGAGAASNTNTSSARNTPRGTRPDAGTDRSASASVQLQGQTGDALSRRSSGRSSPFSGQGGRDDRDLGGVDDRDEGGGMAPGELPELLSEATINTMTRSETMSHLTKVANAKNRGNVDDETREKLNTQQKLLLKRLQALRDG